MRIVVAASLNPSFAHAKAGYIVLASLLEAFVNLGHDVALITVHCPNPIDPKTVSRLKSSGVVFIGDVADAIAEDHLHIKFSLVRRFFILIRDFNFTSFSSDRPQFKKRHEAESRIVAWRPDTVLIFWDSWFEYMLPPKIPVDFFGYLARPRFAAPLARCQELALAQPLTLLHRLKYLLETKLYEQMRVRHLRRISGLKRCANICAIDKAMYESEDIKCEYVPNTWPDAFGSEWAIKRKLAKRANNKLSVLVNIGDVNGTGNRIGINYLADQVLPCLFQDKSTKNRFEFNLCGNGKMDTKLSEKLEGYGVNIKGFVDDIDSEMLANQVLLVLNTSGNYTGGYTRVMYGFSAGSCLVAHSALSESMPEVIHGENALLGTSAREIVDHLLTLASDQHLVRRLSKAGRKTYECHFTPESVAGRLVELMGSARA